MSLQIVAAPAHLALPQLQSVDKPGQPCRRAPLRGPVRLQVCASSSLDLSTLLRSVHCSAHPTR